MRVVNSLSSGKYVAADFTCTFGLPPQPPLKNPRSLSSVPPPLMVEYGVCPTGTISSGEKKKMFNSYQHNNHDNEPKAADSLG